MTKQQKRKRQPKQPKQPPQPTRLEDWQIDGLDTVFTGFAAYYRANYDEQGRRIKPDDIPTLKGGQQ